MAALTLPNDIANATTGDARPIQANFVALETHINASLVHADGSVAVTGPLTVATPSADGHATTKSYVDLLFPVGAVVDYAGAVAPAGWRIANGDMVNKADYPLLYDLIGVLYGAETATQFKLPDLSSRIVAGKGAATWSDTLGETGGSKDAIAVAHTHTSADHVHVVDPPNTAITPLGGGQAWIKSGAGGTPDIDVPFGGEFSAISGGTPYVDIAPFDSAGAKSDAGNTTNSQSPTASGTDANLPPYITLNKIIRLG